MSYKDLVKNGAKELSDLQSKATKEVEGLVFQLASSLAQLKKLVDALGGPKDTLDHRHRLAAQQQRIQGLAKDVKARLTSLSEEGNQEAASSPQLQIKAKKLVQEFASLLQEYKAVQKAAAEREAQHLPRQPPPQQRQTPLLLDLESGGGDAESRQEQAALLQAQKQAELRIMDNAIEYNEALIEERDAGIAEIQRQIGEVNEMFQDLAVLINDQGAQLAVVEQAVVTTAERTREGARELVKAERSQRGSRNKCLVIWLISAIVLSIILILWLV